jgi:[acyl-carrier-protein] S-malonyltransferase
MTVREEEKTAPADGARAAVRDAGPRSPGVAFAGQGVQAEAITATLEGHRDHPLVGMLLARLGLLSVEALDLADTRVSQAATFVAGLAAAHSRFGPAADMPVAVGHSLGEITALAFARAIRPEDGLRLALARGRICHAAQRRRPGAMVAVIGLDHEAVERLRRQVVAEGHGVLEIAGINGRRQIVLSGDRAAVTAVAAHVEGSAARAVQLPIGGAFHSSLMSDALPRWRRALRSVTFVRSEITVVSCIDSRPHREPEAFRELLAAALVMPVRWVDTLDTVRGLGVHQMWEAGPGQVLRSLARRGGAVEFVDVPAQLVFAGE